MIAEEVLSGLPVIRRRPIAGIVIEVGCIRVREIGRASENVVVNRWQVVAGGEHVVQVVIVAAAVVGIAVVFIAVIGIAIIGIRIILIVVAVLIIVLVVLIVVAAVVAAVSKISKIVAHGTSNDGCF